MKLNNKVYDILKWFALVCLPALVIAIPSLFEVWGWSYGEEIAKTLQIIAVLIGTLLGISSVEYSQKEEYKGEE